MNWFEISIVVWLLIGFITCALMIRDDYKKSFENKEPHFTISLGEFLILIVVFLGGLFSFMFMYGDTIPDFLCKIKIFKIKIK